MSELSTGIKNSLKDLQGRSADVVTHALKALSGKEDGTMTDGLMVIVDTFQKDKEIAISNTKRNYGIGGIVTGVIFTATIVGGAWIYSSKEKQKKHEKECETIIDVFKKEAAKEKDNYEKLLCESLGEDENLSGDKPKNRAGEQE